MTAAQRISSVTGEPLVPDCAAATSGSQRSYLDIPAADYLWAFGFLLTQTLTGLSFYPAILIALFMMVVAYRSRPYDLCVMLVFWAGGYSLNYSGYLGSSLILLTLAVAGIVLLKKWTMLKVLILCFVAYFTAVLLIARTSDESMSVQLHMMKSHFMIAYFMVPLLIFANRKFEFHELVRKIITYAVCISLFYVLDCYVLFGHVMFPYANFLDTATLKGFQPSWTHPEINLFAFDFPRIGPFAMVFMILLIYPLTKWVKLRTWQWVFFIAMLIAGRSATLTIAFILTFVIFKMHGKKMWLYIAATIVGAVALYNIDKATGGFLRVESTVDQFTSLDANMSDEELAEFGTGRMAQFIPKYYLLQSYGREWVGFGFLDPEKSKSHKFMIANDMYESTWDIDEVVTGVEVAPLQTILDMGFLGLILQTLLYYGLYFVIRKQAYSKYYLCTIVCATIGGLGGNGGFNSTYSLLPIGLVLGAILLANKPGADQEDRNHILIHGRA